MTQRLAAKDERGRYVLADLMEDGSVRLIYEDGEVDTLRAKRVVVRERLSLKRAVLGLALLLQLPVVFSAEYLLGFVHGVPVTVASVLTALLGATLFKVERNGFEIEIVTDEGKIRLVE